MKSVWVFQDFTEGIVRVFAREDDAKKYALTYFDETYRDFFKDAPKFVKKEKEKFLKDWSADEGTIYLKEVEVE